MSELIARYIHDVTRRLPEKEREEIKRELEASIADMLPDNPSEQDVIDVLTNLGPPAKMAEQYRQKPRYLISPALFDTYIHVLKLVVPIVAGVLACIGVFGEIFSDSVSIGGVIGKIFGGAIEGALQAAFWVTLGFAVADYFGYNISDYALKQKPWTIDRLPPLPDQRQGVKISRPSAIVGMSLSVFFTALFVAMIVRGESFFVFTHNSVIISPFSQAALDRAIPYILLFGALGLVMNGLKLYWGRWTVPLCIANIVNNIVWVSVAITILHWPDLLDQEFIVWVSAFIDDADILLYITQGRVVLFFSAVFILAAMLDIGVSIWNTWRGNKEVTV
ncbi:MAG: hypothetical protein LBI19_08995 [Oscillospiraceae bacterium]|jgi:hypothetical protein|nr:hypothetical protein [Oscillospiraceae bacterium]